MEIGFQKIALAYNFTPTSNDLLKEALRIQKLFSSKLYLIHIGKDGENYDNLLYNLHKETELKETDYELIWREGDPGLEIIKACSEKEIDLLLAGALEKENIIKFYIGSVARKLMKYSPCSIMIFKIPIINKPFRKIFVSIDYSPLGEKALQVAYQLAIKEGNPSLDVVREFYIPGLTATLQDSGVVGQYEDMIEKATKEEEEKTRLFLNEIILRNINIEIHCIYGKEKHAERNFVDKNSPDLYIIPSKIKKPTLWERFVPMETEHIFEDLPSNILIVR
ncbi:MAG TPA: universal stress protein [Candidatus Kapabacteria bacterium]|nr:universal stress protein [Candidatus Kapabacteria bacterium]HOV92575.1 universal stress protein [Candidatus Kapabacteria bacterium]